MNEWDDEMIEARVLLDLYWNEGWNVAFEMKLEISWIVPRIRNEKI